MIVDGTIQGSDLTPIYENGSIYDSRFVNEEEIAFIIQDLIANGGAVPSGAVMAFDMMSCPNGWSDYDIANGRVIIGTGSSPSTNS